ncbi:hypothetical protein K432DRAFT_402303 [Lepidopterella palustris CBS 459.81]|uniref:F-box domain-containing protein n=1 Tax=Lepidopterella palustris CBS 459.81 TaxID=1314670 RepID=A0A8E2EFK5_9PEZI|nr:hypothetical protein K432DRAFT_402303 [Lepidopterella palustris CBS 459.81]
MFRGPTQLSLAIIKPPTQLSDLSNEILWLITKQLEDSDLSYVSTTSRRLRAWAKNELSKRYEAVYPSRNLDSLVRFLIQHGGSREHIKYVSRKLPKTTLPWTDETYALFLQTNEVFFASHGRYMPFSIRNGHAQVELLLLLILAPNIETLYLDYSEVVLDSSSIVHLRYLHEQLHYFPALMNPYKTYCALQRLKEITLLFPSQILSKHIARCISSILNLPCLNKVEFRNLAIPELERINSRPTSAVKIIILSGCLVGGTALTNLLASFKALQTFSWTWGDSDDFDVPDTSSWDFEFMECDFPSIRRALLAQKDSLEHLDINTGKNFVDSELLTGQTVDMGSLAEFRKLTSLSIPAFALAMHRPDSTKYARSIHCAPTAVNPLPDSITELVVYAWADFEYDPVLLPEKKIFPDAIARATCDYLAADKWALPNVKVMEIRHAEKPYLVIDRPVVRYFGDGNAVKLLEK